MNGIHSSDVYQTSTSNVSDKLQSIRAHVIVSYQRKPAICQGGGALGERGCNICQRHATTTTGHDPAQKVAFCSYQKQ